MMVSSAPQPSVARLTDGVSLYFTPGDRPDADTVTHIVSQAQAAGMGACVSFSPADPAEGWLELLASGLTFDLLGLAPAAEAPREEPCQTLGFEGNAAITDMEAIRLIPSGHIVAGAGLQPIVRAMMSVAANLALQMPVSAVGWTPAGTLMEPGYFCRATMNWLGGGPFPALGLTSIQMSQAGATTRGLAHFIGQELQLAGRSGEPAGATVKVAIRVIDRLIAFGRVAEPLSFEVGGEVLRFEPSQFGKLLLGWREEDG